MAGRTNLYVVSLVMFPLAFAAFAVGFGCPVWQASSAFSMGLWQSCYSVFDNCSALDFDSGGDWLIGVRAVEIFALVMLTVAAADICYENCCTNFRGRQLSERLAPGILCIFGGLGGISGIIVYAIKTNDQPSGYSYSWALALAAAGSGLAVLVGVGFCVSGVYFENKKKQEKPKEHINGRTPHLTSDSENYEMNTAYTNKTMYDERGKPHADNLPGHAMYNGVLNRPGDRNSLPPLGVSMTNAPYNISGRGGVGGGGGPPALQPKGSQYYSLSDDRLLDPSFDLSEGFSYQPRSRPTTRAQENYYGREHYGAGGEDPYSRGGRGDDPYSRGGGRGDDPYSRGGGRGDDPYSRGGGRGDDPYSRGGGRGEDPYNRGGREDPYSRGGPRPEDAYRHGGGREEDPYNRANRAPRAGYNDPYGFDRQPTGRGGNGGSGVGVGVGGGSVYDRANYGRPNEFNRDSFYRPGRF